MQIQIQLLVAYNYADTNPIISDIPYADTNPIISGIQLRRYNTNN